MRQALTTGLESLVETIRSTYPDASSEPVRRACESLDPHWDALGERTLRVATRVATLHLDAHAVTASLVGSLLRAHVVEPAVIRDRYGDEVAVLADGVLRLRKLDWAGLGGETSENLRRMFMAMAADVRVLPLPVAMTSNACRRPPLIPTSPSTVKVSATRCMAIIW